MSNGTKVRIGNMGFDKKGIRDRLENKGYYPGINITAKEDLLAALAEISRLEAEIENLVSSLKTRDKE